jgi:tellurite resistance protein
VRPGTRRIRADLRDPVLAPFTSVAVITPVIPAVALAQANLTAARVVVSVFWAATVALGGWLTGQWVAGEIDQTAAHPGYFLPTVAGGLVGSYAAAEVHLHAVAEAMFGIGILCWLLLGSLVLNRLFFNRALPPALVPTLAIELAPPAVAGLAWFALNGGSIDLVARVLGGYAVLMAVVQLRFLPMYRQLHFSPGFWAFTFSYAAAAGDALEWLRVSNAAGRTALSDRAAGPDHRAGADHRDPHGPARAARAVAARAAGPGHPAAGQLTSRPPFPDPPPRSRPEAGRRRPR